MEQKATKENKDNSEERKLDERNLPSVLSESIKLKESNLKSKNNNNNMNNNINPNEEIPDIPTLMNQEKLRQKEEKEKILDYIRDSQFILDTKNYSNSIIIGAFCYTIAFVPFGIYKSRILPDEYTNIWSVMATFGGFGQITAGILELNKKREFTSFLYLIYGVYCLSHYLLRILTDRFGRYDLFMFFLAFFLLSIPAIIYSLKINLFFLLQCISGSLYFLSRSIGEGIIEDIIIEQISGIIQIISGLFSFYIFLSQMLNSPYSNIYIPTFPFCINNIDYIREKKVDKKHEN